MSKGKNILIVEDNSSYGAKLVQILEEHGYYVELVDNPLDGLVRFSQHNFELVISDLKLETMNGVDFLRTIKKMEPNVRTIILTGEPSADSELDAIDVYVDLYLVKEIRSDVLLKYIRNILLKDRARLSIEFKSKAEGITLNVDTREVRLKEEELILTKKEFDILHYFLKNKNLAISREQIIRDVWENLVEAVEERVIDVHIKTLRRKLECQSIVSIRGFGYKWVE